MQRTLPGIGDTLRLIVCGSLSPALSRVHQDEQGDHGNGQPFGHSQQERWSEMYFAHNTVSHDPGFLSSDQRDSGHLANACKAKAAYKTFHIVKFAQPQNYISEY